MEIQWSRQLLASPNQTLNVKHILLVKYREVNILRLMMDYFVKWLLIPVRVGICYNQGQIKVCKHRHHMHRYLEYSLLARLIICLELAF